MFQITSYGHRGKKVHGNVDHLYLVQSLLWVFKGLGVYVSRVNYLLIFG